MSCTHILANTISRLNSASRMRLQTIKVPHNRASLKVLSVLVNQGIISRFHIHNQTVTVTLKYHRGRAVFSDIRLVSKPGKRVYYSLGTLALRTNNHSFSGFYVMSTSHGYLTSHESLLYKGITGEVLIKVEI